MKLDYDLKIHYEASDDFQDIWRHGYTIIFHTPTILNHIKDKFSVTVELGVRYRFTDENLYEEFRDNLPGRGLFGTDDWALYVYKFHNEDYWEGIYGKGYMKKEYPEIGKEIWNNSKDLII